MNLSDHRRRLLAIKSRVEVGDVSRGVNGGVARIADWICDCILREHDDCVGGRVAGVAEQRPADHAPAVRPAAAPVRVSRIWPELN